MPNVFVQISQSQKKLLFHMSQSQSCFFTSQSRAKRALNGRGRRRKRWTIPASSSGTQGKLQIKMKNEVRVLIDKSLKDGVVEVRRQEDRIILVKLVISDMVLNVISAYAPSRP